MINKLEATAKIGRVRTSYTDEELALKLGITKPTLYTRLVKSNWKKGELSLIESIK